MCLTRQISEHPSLDVKREGLSPSQHIQIPAAILSPKDIIEHGINNKPFHYCISAIVNSALFVFGPPERREEFRTQLDFAFGVISGVLETISIF